MKYILSISILLIGFAGTFTACKKANDKNPALLGRWQGREWLIKGQESSQDATKVSFEFLEDGTFNANFGGRAEQGVWRTNGDKLYTKATGSQEIMVKLLRADLAILKFEMNRGGQQETLELVKILPTEPNDATH